MCCSEVLIALLDFHALSHTAHVRVLDGNHREEKTRQIVEFLCVIQDGMWWLSQQFLVNRGSGIE